MRATPPHPQRVFMQQRPTELAAVEATAPPEVVALGAPNRMAMERAAIFESAAAGLRDQLELMRPMVAELEQLER